MNKLWSDRAWDDYLYWQMQDKKTHNVPRYLVIDFSKAENFSNEEKAASNEDVFSISERLIKQNMEAYEVLAK